MAKKDVLPQDLTDADISAENKADREIIPNLVNKAKEKLKDVGAGVAKAVEYGKTHSLKDAYEGAVERKAKGGTVRSSASKRADGIAIRGKTRA